MSNTTECGGKLFCYDTAEDAYLDISIKLLSWFLIAGKFKDKALKQNDAPKLVNWNRRVIGQRVRVFRTCDDSHLIC